MKSSSTHRSLFLAVLCCTFSWSACRSQANSAEHIACLHKVNIFCSRSVLCAKASLVTAFISIFSQSSCLVTGSYAEMRLSDLILYSFPTCAITNQQKWVHFVETNYSSCHLYEQRGLALSLLGAALITFLSVAVMLSITCYFYRVQTMILTGGKDLVNIFVS